MKPFFCGLERASASQKSTNHWAIFILTKLTILSNYAYQKFGEDLRTLSKPRLPQRSQLVLKHQHTIHLTHYSWHLFTAPCLSATRSLIPRKNPNDRYQKPFASIWERYRMKGTYKELASSSKRSLSPQAPEQHSACALLVTPPYPRRQEDPRMSIHLATEFRHSAECPKPNAAPNSK
jgi:hypothetical protein